MPHPGRFFRSKQTRYPSYRRLGGPRGRSGWVRKISPPAGFDPRTVQPKRVAIPTELSGTPIVTVTSNLCLSVRCCSLPSNLLIRILYAFFYVPVLTCLVRFFLSFCVSVFAYWRERHNSECLYYTAFKLEMFSRSIGNST
jgi:hypothetical protein